MFFYRVLFMEQGMFLDAGAQGGILTDVPGQFAKVGFFFWVPFMIGRFFGIPRKEPQSRSPKIPKRSKTLKPSTTEP